MKLLQHTIKMRINMFVTQSKYNRALLSLRICKSERNDMLSKYNRLVERINRLGGEQFLKHATLNEGKETELTRTDIKKLISLCHPDKHDGKKSAVEITQKLLCLRAAG